MADEKGQEAVGAEDAIPIKKTSAVVYIAGGVFVLAVVGLVIGMSGGSESKSQEAAASEKAEKPSEGMTKEEAAERAEHLKRTQAAFAAANAEEAAEANAKKAEEEKKKAEEVAAAQEKKPASSGAVKKPVNKKKTLNSLDGLGADITSALK